MNKQPAWESYPRAANYESVKVIRRLTQTTEIP
jgi:hypothetical protein